MRFVLVFAAFVFSASSVNASEWMGSLNFTKPATTQTLGWKGSFQNGKGTVKVEDVGKFKATKSNGVIRVNDGGARATAVVRNGKVVYGTFRSTNGQFRGTVSGGKKK